MAGGLNRGFEKIGKRITRRLLATLAARHHRKWRGIGEHKDIKRIIVVRQHNQFGDVLCTVPLLRALHKKFDLEELAVVVSPQNIDAIRGCKYVTKIINYDKLSFYKSRSLFINFCKQLRKNYDVLLVPSNVSISLTNDVMAFFIKAKTKIGPKSLEGKANKTSSVYDLALDFKWDDSITHQTFRNMKVASALEIFPQNDDGKLEYEVDAHYVVDINNFLKVTADCASHKIAIHAGAGKAGNRWIVLNFVKLAELLHDSLNAEIYFTEGSFDHETMEHITNMMKVPFIRVRNKSIPFIAALLKNMDVVITNDTGIMHLAAAVGTPTLSLFGPTDPLQWAPLGKRHKFIFGKNGDINSIEVDKVLNLVKKIAVKN
ncbi:MAG: glycosyltransferase family 9 protein [Candidatus Kryptoniota bacterium]